MCDVNRDGKLDIVSGGSWFAGPDFKTEYKTWTVPPVDDYFDDFSDYPMGCQRATATPIS